jgi:hypothetical protein
MTVPAYELDSGEMALLTGRIDVLVTTPEKLDFLIRNGHQSGVTLYNPMRVTVDGIGCGIVFTLRRQPGTADEDFERDACRFSDHHAEALMERNRDVAE